MSQKPIARQLAAHLRDTMKQGQLDCDGLGMIPLLKHGSVSQFRLTSMISLANLRVKAVEQARKSTEEFYVLPTRLTSYLFF